MLMGREKKARVRNQNLEGHKAKRRRGLKIFLLTGTLMCLSFLLFAAIYVLQLDAWHEFDSDKILNAPQCLLIYDQNGEEISCLYGGQKTIRIPVVLSDIPKHVQQAFISAEDARFYDHIGVDFIRILGAAWEDIKAGGYVQGASTISQQLVKLSHLTSEKEISRKLEEAVLAYQMEQQFSKDEILEMYLNYVYFGGGYYGVEAAARGYFGVSAKDLTIAQGAQLAGILKAPSHYAPHLDMDASIGRRNVILDLMQEYGYIDEQQKALAVSEPVQLNNSFHENVRGYYIDLALQQACEAMGTSMNDLLTGGYRLYTAMDQSLQAHVEALMQQEEIFPPEISDAQAALVVINAQTGGVCALMGGRENTTALEYNRAVRIRRQPGSVIKPILSYAPALEEAGYTTVSMLLDEPTDFNGYQPDNYGTKYYGWVTLREAVKRSLNVPAVKVLSEIGVNTGKAFAQKLGISFDEQDSSLALALGGFTYGVSPYQIAGAYAAFAAGGTYSTPSLVLQVNNAKGEPCYTYVPEQEQVMSEANAYILTNMLQSAVEDGTGRRLGTLGMDIAGKTGTTGLKAGGNRDAWMAAYNPEYAIAAWIGYDDDAQGQALPNEVTGGTYPALMISSIFSKIYEEQAAPVFQMPAGVKEYRLDQYTLENQHVAVLANALTPDSAVVREVFVAGTEPTDMSQYWIVPAPPNMIEAQLDADGMPEITFQPLETFILYRLYREDLEGNTALLGEWPGSEGSVLYEDVTAQAGESYSYYVVPAHPQLEIAGKQVIGAASRKVSLQVPQKNLFAVPEGRE